jgi:hypothetical protein
MRAMKVNIITCIGNVLASLPPPLKLLLHLGTTILPSSMGGGMFLSTVVP